MEKLKWSIGTFSYDTDCLIAPVFSRHAHPKPVLSLSRRAHKPQCTLSLYMRHLSRPATSCAPITSAILAIEWSAHPSEYDIMRPRPFRCNFVRHTSPPLRTCWLQFFFRWPVVTRAWWGPESTSWVMVRSGQWRVCWWLGLVCTPAGLPHEISLGRSLGHKYGRYRILWYGVLFEV